MSNRINILQLEPAFVKGMMGLEGYMAASGIDKLHYELIKLRASQINGCAYCMNMHSKDMRKMGESEQRLYTLAGWRDTSFFTEEERAILALTEEVTEITGRVSDATYNEAARLFDEHYLAKLIVGIAVINTWNRISVTTHMEPAKD